VEPLRARQAAEVEALQQRNARAAEVVSSGASKGKGRARATKAALNAGVSDLEERHRREQRRQRTDELRTGLGILAGAYRDRLHASTADIRATPGDARRRRAAIEAVAVIDATVKSLEYNPGELLALQALLARLSRIG